MAAERTRIMGPHTQNYCRGVEEGGIDAALSAEHDQTIQSVLSRF